MFKRVAGVFAGTIGAVSVPAAGAMSDSDLYEVITGKLDGRLTMAIVDLNGSAVAVEFDDERGQIIRGIAAGAILSDLREKAGPRIDTPYAISSGETASAVRVDGDLLVGRASRAETLSAINALELLTEAQRAELSAILALE